MKADPIESFRNAMDAAGIKCQEEIIGDGQLHRFNVAGDKKGRRNGYYVLFLDDHPAGMFGSWKLGIQQTWSTRSAPSLTPERRAAFKAKMAAERKSREGRKNANYQRAAEDAVRIWDAAAEATDDHPYLKRKGVKAHGLRVTTWVRSFGPDRRDEIRIKNALLVPLGYGSKQTRSLQAIFPDRKNPLHRDKDFLAGGQKRGLFHSFGAPAESKPPLIAVCEGYATAASVHECTGLPVVVAFDSRNLLPVCQTLLALQPQSKLLICADNDRWTEKPVQNPGVASALEAADKTGSLYAIPKFRSRDGRPTDFNDLHAREGADVVRAQIDAVLVVWPMPD